MFLVLPRCPQFIVHSPLTRVSQFHEMANSHLYPSVEAVRVGPKISIQADTPRRNSAGSTS